MVNMTDLKVPQCLVCCQPATKRCSSCRLANYCNTNHQRQHWKTHKKSCCPYEIQQNEKLGRHLVAARDLDIKSVIIQELPMIFAPYDIETSNQGNNYIICLGCCSRMSNSTHRCTTCKFPVCSDTCEKMKCHSDYECNILTQRKINFPPKKPGSFYNSILILRLILQKQRNPGQWKKFLEMEHHHKIRTNNSKIRKDQELTIDNLTEYFGRDELYEMVTKEELVEIIERVNINSFGVARQEEGNEDQTFGRGIYLKAASLVSHGCIPNASWGLTHSPNFEMKVFASVPIKKGDTIMIAYHENWNFVATFQRQLSTFDGSQFSCRCSRCMDPTEYSTYLCAVKCSCCEDGYLLPMDPVDLTAEADWNCTNVDKYCQHVEKQDKIMSILRYFEIKTQKVVTTIQHGLCVSDKLSRLDDLYQKLCQLTTQRQPKLHPNHFIVRCVQKEFINLAFANLHELNFQELDTFIFYCEQLLSVASVLAPGFNRHLAILQNYMCQAMLRKKIKAGKEGKTLTVFGSKKLILDYLTKLKRMQNSVIEYYEFDPDTKPPNGLTSQLIQKLMEDSTIVDRDIKLTLSNMIK